MFYFQQLLNRALGGIDATNVIPAVSNMAFAILLIGFLIGLYQAVLHDCGELVDGVSGCERVF